MAGEGDLDNLNGPPAPAPEDQDTQELTPEDVARLDLDPVAVDLAESD